MKIKRAFYLWLLIAAVSAVNIFAQTNPPVNNDAAEFFGTTGEGVYRNGFLGFSINFPKSWTPLNQEQITQSVEIGQDILKGQDKKNSRIIEEAAQKEVLILVITEKNGGLENTANLSIGVRKQPSSQVTSEMVIDATKKLLLGNLSIQLVADTQKVKFGGETFSTVELQNNWKGIYIYQKLFTAMRKGYSVTFVLTYKKSESRQAMENIMQSLKFTN